MKSALIDWDKDLPPEPDEEYQALVRSLQWTTGFNLLFIQGSPAEGERIIARVKADIPEKKIEVLRLDRGVWDLRFHNVPIKFWTVLLDRDCLAGILFLRKAVYNFYDIIEALPNRDEINILFVKGLEYSLYEYEEEKRELGWESQDIYSYSWKGVPPFLINLNQQRERFRDNFNICFAFVLPRFAIDYFIHRAPDFFDWRSGLFKVSTETEIIAGVDLEELRKLSDRERQVQLLEIKTLLEENRPTLTVKQKADALHQQGLLLVSEERYEEAISSFDEAIALFEKTFEIKEDSYKSWHYRGVALSNVDRYEEAVASFDKALDIELNDHQIWTELGEALLSLERYKEALASCDEAIKLKDDFPQAWYCRGLILRRLGRFQEAIASYDKAIEIQPNYSQALASRIHALDWLDRDAYNNELISSAEQAVEFFKPGNPSDWIERGYALHVLGYYEEAIAYYDKALELEPNNYRAGNDRGVVLIKLGRYKEAIASYDKALEIKPDAYIIWANRGEDLQHSGRYKEAIVSYYKGLRSISVKDIGIFLRELQAKRRELYSMAIDLLKSILQDFLKRIGFRN